MRLSRFRTRAPALALGAALVVVPCCIARSASAGELVLASGPSAGATTWRGDAFVAQALRVGYRPTPRLALDVATSAGFATVDQRITANVGLGMTVFLATEAVRPFVRLGLVHQHEESASNVREDPLETLSAVGPDVRHRSAAMSSLGLEVRAFTVKRTELFLAFDANATAFVDARGPSLYAGGGLWLGLHHTL
jgi:hypothetical protein